MQRTLLTLAIFGMLVCLLSGEQVLITCVNDTTCASGHKMTFASVAEGNQFASVESCPDIVSCPFDEYKIEAYYCERSFTGATCSSGICFYPIESNFCFDDYLSTCDSATTSTAKCQACTSLSCSTGNCISYNNQEYCYEAAECDYDEFQVESFPCTNGIDAMREQCACCARIEIAGPYGICSSGYEVDTTEMRSLIEAFENTNVQNTTSSELSTGRIGLTLMGLLSICMWLI